MKTLLIMLLAALVMTVLFMGCAVYEKEDGSMGFRVGISEKTHETIGKVGDSATGILGMLSAFIPALAPIAVGAGVGTGVWKKMKKTVTKYRDPMEMYVRVLEGIKTTDQATWDKVKAQIKAEHPTVDVEKTIKDLKAELVRLNKLPQTVPGRGA